MDLICSFSSLVKMINTAIVILKITAISLQIRVVKVKTPFDIVRTKAKYVPTANVKSAKILKVEKRKAKCLLTIIP